MQRGIPVIPVLLGDTKMPSADSVPDSLKDFVFRQAVKVDPGRDFEHHMDHLTREIDRVVFASQSRSLSQSDHNAAKCILIFWCLFAFIACGFEHGVAIMTILLTALLSANTEGISVAGAAHNLFWVTIGNIISGSAFVGAAYWTVARSKVKIEAIAT